MISICSSEYLNKFILYFSIYLYYIIIQLILLDFDIYYEFFGKLLMIIKVVSLFIVCIHSLSYKLSEYFGFLWMFAISIIEIMYIIIHGISIYKYDSENNSNLIYLIWEFTNNIQFWITSWTYYAFNITENDPNIHPEEYEYDNICIILSCILNCLACITVLLHDIIKFIYNLINDILIIPILQFFRCIYENIIYPSYKFICSKFKNMYNCLKNSCILCKTKIQECFICNLSCECNCKFGEKSSTNNNSDVTLAIKNELTSDICPICLDKIHSIFKKKSTLHCGHTFHTLCIENWVESCPTNINDKTKATCPECRKEFVLPITSIEKVSQV